MTFSRIFIARPIFAIALSVAIVVIGLVAMSRLPISQYPEVVPPTVTITANYPGASAQVIADTVATPIEQEVNGVDGMLYMYSQATDDGKLNITVTFALGTNLDEAQVLVQNRVALAEPRLPEEVRRTGVAVRKNAPDFLLVVQLLSPDRSRDQLYLSNYASSRVRDVLARLPGVGSIQTFGARDYSMRLWLDPDKIAELGLTAGEVVAAVRAQNIQVAGGALGQPPTPSDRAFQPLLTLRGRLQDPSEFGQIIVKHDPDGRIVRLTDVGRIELGANDYTTNAYLNGQPLIAMLVFQRPGTNALQTSRDVQTTMDRLGKSFPSGVEYRMTYNPTEFFVRTSIEDLVHTIYEAVLLVVLVVLAFLQKPRATLIPILAIPVSLIGTFAIMAALGFTINTLTLFALVLAVGIVVDDAIVVVENVERFLAEGLSPREAAVRTMDEVGGALISIALVLASVFVPTMFLEGISGQFFRQFAVVISVATLISAFNSLTLSPALAGLLLRAEGYEHRPGRFAPLRTLGQRVAGPLRFAADRFNRGFARLSDRYGRLTRRVVERHRRPALIGYAVLLAATVAAFMHVPRGFVPAADQGYLIVTAQLPSGASLARSDRTIAEIARIARAIPGVQYAHMFTGFAAATGTTASNAGTVFVQLRPFDDRHSRSLSAEAIQAELQKRLAAVDTAQVNVIAPPSVRGIGAAGGFSLRVEDVANQGPAALDQATQALMTALRADPRIAFVFSPFENSTPEIFVNVDRAKAEMLQVPVGRVFETLEVYVGSAYVNDFNLIGRTYQVRAQAEGAQRLDVEQISKLQTRSDTGAMVPLGTLATFQVRAAPARVPHYNLYPASEVIGAARQDIASGEALDLVEKAAARALPPGFEFEWTELSYQQRLAGGGIVVFALSILFVFLTLSGQYESWSLPFAVILIVPMCLLSAMLGLMLLGQDNNLLTQVGLVVLIGLAAKNAILIVEFARQLEDQGRDLVDATVEACRLRLRPILMTSFAFILGVVPLMTAAGAGAELRHAIGTAVFFGMLGVSLFGLAFTPVFYVTIRRFVVDRAARKAAPASPFPVSAE